MGTASRIRTVFVALAWLLVVPHRVAKAELPKAPDSYKPLLKAGAVKISFLNRDSLPADRCEYRLGFQFKHTSKHQFKKVGDRIHLSCQVKITGLTLEASHLLFVGNELENAKEELWRTNEVQEGLDCVAISADPRLVMLEQHLAQKITTLETKVPRGTKLSADLIGGYLREEVDLEHMKLMRLIRENYRRFTLAVMQDELPFADRDKFFNELYLRENLKTAEYESLSAVEDLLDTDEYLRAQRIHIPRK